MVACCCHDLNNASHHRQAARCGALSHGSKARPWYLAWVRAGGQRTAQACCRAGESLSGAVQGAADVPETATSTSDVVSEEGGEVEAQRETRPFSPQIWAIDRTSLHIPGPPPRSTTATSTTTVATTTTTTAAMDDFLGALPSCVSPVASPAATSARSTPAGSGIDAVKGLRRIASGVEASHGDSRIARGRHLRPRQSSPAIVGHRQSHAASGGGAGGGAGVVEAGAPLSGRRAASFQGKALLPTRPSPRRTRSNTVHSSNAATTPWLSTGSRMAAWMSALSSPPSPLRGSTRRSGQEELSPSTNAPLAAIDVLAEVAAAFPNRSSATGAAGLPDWRMRMPWALPSAWATVEEALSQRLCSTGNFEEAVRQYRTGLAATHGKFECLRRVVRRRSTADMLKVFHTIQQLVLQVWVYCGACLPPPRPTHASPRMTAQLQAPKLLPSTLPRLPFEDGVSAVAVTRQQAACLVALFFACLLEGTGTLRSMHMLLLTRSLVHLRHRAWRRGVRGLVRLASDAYKAVQAGHAARVHP